MKVMTRGTINKMNGRASRVIKQNINYIYKGEK